jgi:gamma-glutamylcyclotransferase (GGCT)/AIG2-like uncharacterized protein YtfP
MNSVDMMHSLITRAKNLQEFTVTTDVPEDFRFNGMVPFDMEIKEGTIYAKVYGIDFNEAVERLNEFLETCK